ncbi:MAG TPA: hypothetical protein VNW29_07320 [Candidatus Sulfotelmatobacter sp.]|jgi:hypothetical protein|nr:hypothetical protein [Candidatus Sulfotelmatobacter sp.]
MSYKELLGIIATVIAFISYIPYFRDIFANTTKPHAFSWLVWSMLTGIGFFGQVSGGAGAGAWVTGFTAIISFIIFIFGFIKGRTNIILIDWLCLMGAVIALIFWFITKGPLLSVIIITVIDAFGFFPTFRKSFIKPHEETVITYFLSGLKFIFSLFALQTVSVVTILYPLSLVVMNWIFVIMVLVRKQHLQMR